jgi:hypothetical protein
MASAALAGLRTNWKTVLLILVLAAGLAFFMPGSQATAHNSTYCGHGLSGINPITKYGHKHDTPNYHYHHYYHYIWMYDYFEFDHAVEKEC